MDSGNHDQTATKISKLKGMSSVEVHIGNSDIVAHVLYKNTKELLNLLVHLKKMEGVENIEWPKQVYSMPPDLNETIESVSEQKEILTKSIKIDIIFHINKANIKCLMMSKIT